SFAVYCACTGTVCMTITSVSSAQLANGWMARLIGMAWSSDGRLFALCRVIGVSLAQKDAQRHCHSGLTAVGDFLQALVVANGDALTPALDDTGSFPCAYDPADRVQSGRRHFGDILTTQRKINQGSRCRRLPGLVRQFEDRVRHTPFDIFS